MYKIAQSKFLDNQLLPLRKTGVNIVSSADGIIIAGKVIGINLRREAKNRVHVTAIHAGDLVPAKDWDFPNLSDAIKHCAILVDLDLDLTLRKEQI